MPTERRPLDHALVSLAGKPEEEAVAWWKARFEQIAAIPLATARAGALVPEWRELATLPERARLALTRARVLASEQLTPDQRDRVFEARAIGRQQVPGVAEADVAFVREKVVPTMPPDLQERMRRELAERQAER